MPHARVAAAGLAGRLPALVEAYARRVAPAVLAQHRGASVSSALGVWLLLAACVDVAQDAERAALEEALGCSAADAGALLTAFMARVPPALQAAIAVWVRAQDATEALAAWVRSLPEGVESGFMPTASEADAWASRETLGLIERFPLQIDQYTRVVLASALATRVSWEVPFELVPAADRLGGSSPWRGSVSRLLWDQHPAGHAMIARTEAAGLVAVHCAVAREDLTVVSVSAAPDVDRVEVVGAAHEVAASVGADWERLACSLYDLELGPGHSWDITEQEVHTLVAQPRMERMAGAALPAWDARAEVNLRASDLFRTGPALEALRRLIGPQPDDECQATQAAVASFTRYGFEAAAVTALGIRAAAALAPGDRVLERSAILRFDHPYAAVAVCGRPGTADGVGDPTFRGLPVFSAWVAEPVEPRDEEPPGAAG